MELLLLFNPKEDKMQRVRKLLYARGIRVWNDGLVLPDTWLINRYKVPPTAMTLKRWIVMATR